MTISDDAIDIFLARVYKNSGLQQMAGVQWDHAVVRAAMELATTAPVVGQAVFIDYTNYRGVREIREITPIDIRWDSTAFHPEPQWLLRAFDTNSQAERSFAMVDIHRMMTEAKETKLRRLVHTALGEASMCWTDNPPPGKFDSEMCTKVGDKLIAAINKWIAE